MDNSAKLILKARRWLSKSRSHRNKDPQTPPPSSPFPFLLLPSEIRNQIYRHLLLCTHPLIYHFHRCYWYTEASRPSLALLLTCRQVHAEAAAVFYGENTWFTSAPQPIIAAWGEPTHGERATYSASVARTESYVSWVRRLVVFPDGPPNWYRDGIVGKGDVEMFMKRLGWEKEGLREVVVGCLTEEMCDEIEEKNGEWLEEVDEEEMERRFWWYREEEVKPAYWLVSKEREVVS